MRLSIESLILWSDVDKYFDLIYESLFKPRGLPRTAIYRNINVLLTAKRFIATDKDTGQVVATAAMYLTSPDEAYIGRMIIAPRYRNQGIGSLMLAYVEADAIKKGCIRTTLMAASDVELYYEKKGYIKQSQVYQPYPGLNLHFRRMIKSLHPRTKL